MTIPLGRPLPDASRDLPGRRRENTPGTGVPGACRRPYLVLLPVGFAVPRPLPAARCALTAPFHPCRPRPKARGRRSALCGTFPGVAPAGRYPAPCVRGARTFLPPPVPKIREERPSGRLAQSAGRRSARLRSTAGSGPAIRRAVGGRSRPTTGLSSALDGRDAARNARNAAGRIAACRSRTGPSPLRLAESTAGRSACRRPERDAGAREPLPVEQLARILLARRRHVGMAEHAWRGIGWRRKNAARHAIRAAICASGNGR